jgi:Ca2+-binding RTX toxin-like protein
MDAGGGNVRRLTNNTLIDANPSWSPDGTRLVFERCCDGGTSDIYTIDVASRVETALTGPSTQDFDPSWSPDGTRIAFVSFEPSERNIDIWVMNADGSSPTRLTDAPGPHLSPDWQPIPTCTISGTDQPDDLTGTEGNDVICARGGNDQVAASSGDDLVIAGPGADVVDGQDGSDLLLGEGGDDVLAGGSEYDVIDGGPGLDTCTVGGGGASRRLCEN